MNMKCRMLVTATSLLILHVVRAAAENEWPREMENNGHTITMYQPQLDKLDGNMLHARAAVSVLPPGKDIPVFGAVWLEARIETDLTSRMVVLLEVNVPKVHFADASEKQKQQFADFLAGEIPTWNLTLSQDRMLAMLDMAEKQSIASEGFDDHPPKIIFADQPTVLVNIDGAPKFVPIEGSDLERVINSPFLIIRDQSNLYLYGGSGIWYGASDVSSHWNVLGKVPPELRKQQPPEEESDSGTAPANPNEQPPAIRVATEPTELINIAGKPEYKILPGNKLNYVSNTDSDLFMELASQRYFILLSGRWFSARTLKGPWDYVPADQLPESFADIPANADEGDVRTWVAGTEEANEAILEASIPQTAAIRRDATINVVYDGAPKFKKIEGTSLSYAINTASQVLQTGSRFYCAQEGAWYTADAAKGPWITATSVPEEIRSIPASNPLYNVKFLYIYGYNDEVVYFGYYPGYTYTYVYNGTIVYGTGWYYSSWYGSRYYYHHGTWGYHMHWHRWYGWGSSCRYRSGRYSFCISHYSHYHRGLWGPSGYRQAYRRGYYRGYNNARRDTQRNIYQNKANLSRVVNSSRISNAIAQRPATKTPMQVINNKNNVFADKYGNVMRKNDRGTWETRQGGQWTTGDRLNIQDNRTGNRLENRGNIQLPQHIDRSSMERAFEARDRGTLRSRNFQQSRTPSRSGGGGRSGGGRGGRR